MPTMTPDSTTPGAEQWERAARAYYEEHAATAYARLLAADTNALEALYRPFLAHVPSRGHILDAGCGSGRDSRVFLDRGYRVTALDGSAAMAVLASAYVGQPVLHLAFQEIAFQSRFDGVWASASLLHVRQRAMPDALRRLSRALKPGGVLYASFMVGEGEGQRGGLLFTSYREESFAGEIARHPELQLLLTWQAADPPPTRKDVHWLHALVQKRASTASAQ